MHVDGFRFDLASVLGRGENGFEREAAFFACVAQDPQLAGVKLIAEPWDLGPRQSALTRLIASRRVVKVERAGARVFEVAAAAVRFAR
jgi:pullulanase/glycogen debranching enzyme